MSDPAFALVSTAATAPRPIKPATRPAAAVLIAVRWRRADAADSLEERFRPSAHRLVGHIALNVIGERTGRLISIGRFMRHRFEHDGLQGRGNRMIDFAGPRKLTFPGLDQDLEGIVAHERRAPSQDADKAWHPG